MIEAKSVEFGDTSMARASQAEIPVMHLVRQGLMTVSPELARRMISEAPFVGQRHVNYKHVAVLAELMRRDVWTSGTQIHFGRLEDDESLHLLNGQHRLHAVIAAQVPVQFQILISPAIDRRELATLYWRHDRAARLRGAADVLDAAGISEQYGLKKQMARAGYAAIGIIMCGFEKPESLGDPFLTRSDEARLNAARSYWPLVARYQELVDPAPASVKRAMMGAGVTAVALLTLQHDRARAEEFWGSIAENNGLQKSDPRHSLLRDFINRKLNAAPDWAKVVAAAWNAFCRGDRIDHLRISDGPPVIAGTSYTKHRKQKTIAAKRAV